jgi:hypothetical protein
LEQDLRAVDVLVVGLGPGWQRGLCGGRAGCTVLAIENGSA